MRQLLIKDGSVYVAEVPAPDVGARNVLVRVAYSCISSGTEMVSVQMSGLPLYKRALRQPANVKKVLDMVRQQGLRHAMQRVQGTLNAGSPTGYSVSGTVIAIGDEVDGLGVGDRVACAGAGIANHAEFVDVPVNLAVRVPLDVTLADAATVTLGAIALQGVRRAAPTLGETIVVVGLGLLGQLAVQMLRANGCRVVGIDPDPLRRSIAKSAGATVLDAVDGAHVPQIIRMTEGGADAVIVTAASSSDVIMSEAFHACRRKGRVVIVGDVGLGLQRADFYAKEIDVLISASYGPGRYDPYYEEGGQDYPIGYVRWTENRNMAAYLSLVESGSLRLAVLDPRVFPLAEAPEAYASLRGAKTLLALLQYDAGSAHPMRSVALEGRPRPADGRVRVAVVGAGGFARGMHLPNLQALKSDYEIRCVVSRTGANAKAVAQQYGAAQAATDADIALADPCIDLVLIATRHDLHASLALKALRAGKHVLVEKPLALSEDDLRGFEEFYQCGTDGKPVLMTGFNRRFSPAVLAIARMLADRSAPMIVNYRMNAGYIPVNHWVHGPEGGGRNVGEACHIYDLFHLLTGAPWTTVDAKAIRPRSAHWRADDNFVATSRHADGSVCTLTYTALGHSSHPKERMEVYCDGMVAVLDDYRSTTFAGRPDAGWSSKTQRKGQLEELQHLAECLRRHGPWPVGLPQQLATMRLAFEVQRQLLANNHA